MWNSHKNVGSNPTLTANLKQTTMRKQTKLTNFLIVTFIVWVLTYIGFAFILNESNAMDWERGDRFGMVLLYALGAGMTALGIYGD